MLNVIKCSQKKKKLPIFAADGRPDPGPDGGPDGREREQGPDAVGRERLRRLGRPRNKDFEKLRVQKHSEHMNIRKIYMYMRIYESQVIVRM